MRTNTGDVFQIRGLLFRDRCRHSGKWFTGVHLNSLVFLGGKLLSSDSFQYGLTHILFIGPKNICAIRILKH